MTRNFEIVSKETRYENPWMAVREYKILRDGKPGIYGVVDRQDSVTTIVKDPSDRILFVQQYRFPTESYSWELPMGGVDEGEDPLDSARRELVEETGIKADLEKLGSFHPIPGLTSQHVTVYSVRVDAEIAASLDRFAEDVDEIVSRRFISKDEVKRMISEGDISDGFTLCSLALIAYLG